MEYSKKRMLGAMRANCFRGLEKLIKVYDIKNVLEFGSGYSSCWFVERVNKLYTVDTNSEWFPKDLDNVICITINRTGKNLRKIAEIKKIFDLILIDCFSHESLRQKVFEYVRNNLDWKLLCIHDWGRNHKKYDNKYLSQFKSHKYGELKVFVNKILTCEE